VRASILDLRYKMKEVLEALDRNETVDILYHGKLKGVITPASDSSNDLANSITSTSANAMKVQDHPFFGSDQTNPLSVEEQMSKLRRGRYRDL